MNATLKKVWSLFTPEEKTKAAIMLLLTLLMAVIETLSVVSIMPFLSVLGRPDVITEQPILHTLYKLGQFTSHRDFIIALGFASISFVLGSSIFKTLTQYKLNRFLHFQKHSISSRLLNRYIAQPYEYFLTRNSAELSKNVLSETDQILNNIINPLAQLITQGIIVIAMVLLITFYDPLNALIILFAISVLYVAIYRTFRKKLSFIGQESVEANRQRYQASNEAFGGIRDIKMSNAIHAYLQRFNAASHIHARHSATSNTLSQTPLFAVEAVGYCGLIIIALTLLARTDDIAHVLPALGLYAFAAYRLLPAAQIMYRGFAQLRFAKAALDNIAYDLSLPLPTPNNTNPAPIVPHKHIRLENIHFAYPSAFDKKVFVNFSITIPANQTTGISGKSGAGKSTLMDLLLGLIQPQSGKLYIDDTVIDVTNVQAWQQSIGYVPQHIYLADNTIAANIAFGIPEDDIDHDAVIRAAKAAQIHEFIQDELADGYQTFIGERGIRLSGGQRQRIGIARALYHDPAVIFLDEATSALDAATEKNIYYTLQMITPSKTIILITHQKEFIKDCELTIEI